MNNFRFNEFIPWHQLDFVSTKQESVPLSDPAATLEARLISMFGTDFEGYMTFTELGLLAKMEPMALSAACPNNQLPQENEKLTDFVFWIALPKDRLLNFISTGILYLEDFPHMGRREDNLRLNFSLNARSALLLLTFSQSLSRMHGGHFDESSGIVLLSFKLGLGKLFTALGSGNMGLWNRKYLDYFVNVPEYLALSSQELDTLQSFTFSGYDIKTLVNQMNDELDAWVGPQGQKTFHWRHFHLALHNLNIVEQLLGLETMMEASEETLTTLTKTFSQLNLGVMDVAVGTLESQEESDEVVLCTRFGTKYHFYENCHGLNKKTFAQFPLSKVESCRELCVICKDRRLKEDFVTMNFPSSSSSSKA